MFSRGCLVAILMSASVRDSAKVRSSKCKVFVWQDRRSTSIIKIKFKNNPSFIFVGFWGEPADVGLSYHSDKLLLSRESSDFGISNFNNPVAGLATIFQCITLEGWSKIMFDLMDQQIPFIVVPFFIILIIVGAFFLIHAILAVFGY